MTPCSATADPSLFHWSEEDLSEEDLTVLMEMYSHEDNFKHHALRDFFRSHFPDYLVSHSIQEEKVSVMNSIMACKTGKLGYTLIHCKNCGKTEVRACACGNRNCPSCGFLNEQRWIALRQAEVIPSIPYFHLVFTLPHQLNQIMYQNQKATLNLLFHSVKDTILDLSRDKLSIVPGILMVLHTFGANLSLHYHLHVLVSGGGLSLDRSGFKRCLSNTFFLPLKALERVYKGKYLDGLKQLREEKCLSYLNDAEKYRNSYMWKELMNECYKTGWNIEIKPLAPADTSKKHSGQENTDNVVSYFARYTNRTAISDSRIIGYDDHNIRFRYKDYDGSSYTVKVMELNAGEFIRRFLMHILPPGFMKVRMAGFLAGCVRKKNLERIYTYLGQDYREPPEKSMNAADLINHIYHCDITLCDKCHSKLDIYPRMDRRSIALFIRAA